MKKIDVNKFEGFLEKISLKNIVGGFTGDTGTITEFTRCTLDISQGGAMDTERFGDNTGDECK